MTVTETRKVRLIMHLRSMGISDTDVLSAMEKVPREVFVPQTLKDQAYDDIALPIGRGQTISQPFIVASMTQALNPGGKLRVLEIGTGSGYQSCVLAHLFRRVYTIERHKPLLQQAEKIFDQLKLRNITSVAGDGMKGWPDQSSFDRIICTAAAQSDRPPQVFLEQLKDGGILVLPVTVQNQQILRRYKKESPDTFAVKDLMPVRFVPLLPDLADDDKKSGGKPKDVSA